jgi:hypothetical protein
MGHHLADGPDRVLFDCEGNLRISQIRDSLFHHGTGSSERLDKLIHRIFCRSLKPRTFARKCVKK